MFLSIRPVGLVTVVMSHVFTIKVKIKLIFYIFQVLGVVMAVLGFYFVTRWQSLPDQSMHPSSPRLGPSLTMALIGCALCLVAIFAWLVLAEKCICINLFSRKGNSRPDTEYMPMNSVTNPQAELILANGGL